MSYASLRSNIKSGDILAFRGTTFISRFIRMWTGGSWSHVAIAWVHDDRVFLMEAREFNGVEIRAVSESLPCDWISTGAVWSENIERLAMERLGKPYSYKDCLRVGVGLKPTHDDRVCSVYASTVLRAGGVHVPDRPQTPQSLVSHLLDSGCPLRTLSPEKE